MKRHKISDSKLNLTNLIVQAQCRGWMSGAVADEDDFDNRESKKGKKEKHCEIC